MYVDFRGGVKSNLALVATRKLEPRATLAPKGQRKNAHQVSAPSLCLCRNARPGHVSASARYSHSSISYDYFCVEEQRLKFRLGCANKVSMPPRWVHEHKQKHNSIHEQLSHTSQNYVLFFAR